MQPARLIVVAVLALTLGACAGDAGQTAAPETPVSKPTATTEKKPEKAPEPESDPVKLTVPESGFSNGDGTATFGHVRARRRERVS